VLGFCWLLVSGCMAEAGGCMAEECQEEPSPGIRGSRPKQKQIEGTQHLRHSVGRLVGCWWPERCRTIHQCALTSVWPCAAFGHPSVGTHLCVILVCHHPAGSPSMPPWTKLNSPPSELSCWVVDSICTVDYTIQSCEVLAGGSSSSSMGRAVAGQGRRAGSAATQMQPAPMLPRRC